MIKKGYHQEFDNETFLQIVQTAFPQETCNKWSQVARKYYLQTGQKINKTQELRRKFDVLTKLDLKFSNEQKLLMYKLDVLARGVKKLGLSNYKKEMESRNENQLIYQSQFYRCASSHLREAFRQIQELFDNHRRISNYDYSKSNNRREDKVGLPSIYILLRAQDILPKRTEQFTGEEKWIAEKLIQVSIQCEKMLLLYIQVHLQARPVRYESFQKIVNRREFKQFIFFLKYVDILRKIHIENSTIVTMQSHPLIHPNPKVNKKTLLYKTLIVQNDWTDKYQLFHECIASQVLEEDMSMVIEKKRKNVKNSNEQSQVELHKNKELQVFRKLTGAKVIKAKKKQGEIAKFRGQFLAPGEHKNMDRLTRTFHFEDDSEYDEKEQDLAQLDMDAQEAKTRMEKLQELYHEAFLKIPNQKFLSYYSDR